MGPEKILNEVKTLVLQELKDADVRVYLFGSWARGEQRQTSDIDIAIEYDNNLTPTDIAKLRESLEESHIPYRVDVVDLTRAGYDLTIRVKEEGILWKDYAKG
jgi:hypothetical protein